MTETITICVSKKTSETLARLREKIGAESLDAAIHSLVKKQCKTILEKMFIADRGSIKPFTEVDRGEDRSWLICMD